MNEVENLAAYCKLVLKLETANLGSEYGYACLPLCVIDAVWSIGVRYGGVKNVVSRYSAHFDLRSDSVREQHCLSDLVGAIQSHGVAWFTKEVFQNAQRTSTRSGILKAEAVFLFASALHRHGINRIEDMPKITQYENLADEIKKPYAQELLTIPGQRSGVSLFYFYMLTGSSGIVKPDRMVNGFLKDALGREVTNDDSQHLLSHVSRHLTADFPLMTPRMLDHEIWKYQSGRAAS